MRWMVLLLALAAAGGAAAQAVEGGGAANATAGNGSANGTVGPPLPFEGDPAEGHATANGTPANDSVNETLPEEAGGPDGGRFPVGLILLVIGALIVVGLLIFAASRP